MKSLTASDRNSLTKLAASLPKGSEERRAILNVLGSHPTNKTANDDLYASDYNGNKYSMEELDRMVRGTISELTGLLGNTKSFYKKLKSGRLDDGDNFMDFTPPMEDGYDRTGPREIEIFSR